MMRFILFLLGLGMFLLGAASNFQGIPVPIDSKAITLSIASGAVTLDVVLLVAGVFVMLVAWLFHKLASGNL